MPVDLFEVYLRLPAFMLALARVSAVLAFVPILGSLSIPIRVRALLAVALASLATPLAPLASEPRGVPELAVGLGGELLLGALFGLVLRICFVGMEMAGMLIAQESGLAFGTIADPTTSQDESVLSVFYSQLAAVVFLSLGGHRMVVAAALDSFHGVPLLASFGVLESGFELALDALATAGSVAIRVAAPIVVTLFLTNVAMGFVARTAPQLNVVTIGFSIKGALTFLLIGTALPGAVEVFSEELARAMGWLDGLLRG